MIHCRATYYDVIIALIIIMIEVKEFLVQNEFKITRDLKTGQTTNLL